MKVRINVIFSVILTAVLLFYRCGKNPIEPINEQPDTNYFPNNNGTIYNYSIEFTDSNNVTMYGDRICTYSGFDTKNSTNYQVLIDEFIFPDYSFNHTSHFRKIDNGVLFFRDTSTSNLPITDSLKSQILLDQEAKLLYLPLSLNQNWLAYKGGIYHSGYFFNLVNVSAEPEHKEALLLNVNNTLINQETVKIKFTMVVFTNVNAVPQNYSAYAWIADDIGTVRLEGESEIINFLIGKNLFLPGGNVKQTLKNYSIP